MELPQVQTCNRCGECCRRGGECVMRPWAGLTKDFEGRCEILQDLPDGTTNCRLIEAAQRNTGPAQVWAGIYITGECSFPDWRKEICASV